MLRQVGLVIAVVLVGCASGRSWRQMMSSNFVGDGTNDLSIAMLQSVTEKHENYVFSPLGYSAILAILAEGARGNTRNQLVHALRLPEDTYAVRRTYNKLLASMQERGVLNKPEFKNWFYVYKNYSVEQSYKDILLEHYLTEVKNSDYDVDSFGNPEVDEKPEASSEEDKSGEEDSSEEIKDSSEEKKDPSEEQKKPMDETKESTHKIKQPSDEKKNTSEEKNDSSEEDKKDSSEEKEESSEEKKDSSEEKESSEEKNSDNKKAETEEMKEEEKKKQPEKKKTGAEEKLKKDDEDRLARLVLGRSDSSKNKDILTALSANRLCDIVHNERAKHPRSRMIVFNGLYFRGNWSTGFRLLPESSTFYTSPSEKKQVPFIAAEGVFNLGRLSHLQASAIEIPYQGERYSLLVVLPDARDGLDKLVISLSGSELARIEAQLNPANTLLTLPKFKFYTISHPKPALSKIGVEDIFAEAADLSGISGAKGLYLDDLVQLVTLEVDEADGQTNFLTASRETTRNNIGSFSATHPFLFFLRDRIDNLVIIAGKVNDPSIVN